jgi:hypothetical protein
MKKGCVTIVLNVPFTLVTPHISTTAILSNRRFSSSYKSDISARNKKNRYWANLGGLGRIFETVRTAW